MMLLKRPLPGIHRPGIFLSADICPLRPRDVARSLLFSGLQKSAGPKVPLTPNGYLNEARTLSAFGGRADTAQTFRNVRLCPKADIAGLGLWSWP